MTQIDLSAPQDDEKLTTIAAVDGTEHCAPARSLRAMAISGSVWTLAGHALGQVFRLGGNLVLTRLLFPEVFGLLALVQIFTRGVQMFSDIGLRGGIVQDRRGDDRDFLNTAWTLQVIRGVLLWGCLCLLAWPAAWFYEAPSLTKLIPVVGLAALINGFDSTAKYSLIRHVAPAKLVAMDLSTQVMGLGVMIAFAWVKPSVWALVAGGLFGAVAKTLWSHFLITDYSNRFAFDREAARSLFRFGKWILISTAVTFLLTQGDRLVLGKMLTVSELGVYSIALVLSQAMVRAVMQLSATILFPVYARLSKRGTNELRRNTARMRLALMTLALPPVWMLAILGQPVVSLLYDDRYLNAGWMLQILAVGAVATCVVASAEPVVLANGDSFRHMLLQVVCAIFLAAGMAVGGMLGGLPGLLIGVSAARLLGYLPLAVAIRPYGVWLPKLDLLFFGVSAAVITLGLWLF